MSEQVSYCFKVLGHVGLQWTCSRHSNLPWILTKHTAHLNNPMIAVQWTNISSWEANRPSASPAIPRMLWNSKVQYRIYKPPSPVPVLSQNILVHSSPSSSWRPILILFSNLRVGVNKWSPFFRSPHQNPICTSSVSHTCYMSRPSSFDQPNVIWWQYLIFN
jgi:hypothetical protein